MPDIYLLIDGQQQGPYTEEQVRQSLAQGQISNDLASWHDGLPEWVPVSELLENILRRAPPSPEQKIKPLPFSKHAIATLCLTILAIFLFPLIGLFGFVPVGVEAYLAERSIRTHNYRGRAMLTISFWLISLGLIVGIILSILIAVSH